MANPFSNSGANINGPSIGPIAVTPDDEDALSSPIRCITIAGAGTVSTIGWDGVTYTSAELPPGSYPCFATHIRSTGTSATDITGWI